MNKELRKLLIDITALVTEFLLNGEEGDEGTPAPKKEKPSKANKKKVEEIEEDFLPEEEEAEEDEASSDDEESEEEETEEEVDEEEEELSAKELSEVKSALNKYSAKHGREKAVKTLKKFAPVVTRLTPSQVKPLLKALKV